MVAFVNNAHSGLVDRFASAYRQNDNPQATGSEAKSPIASIVRSEPRSASTGLRLVENSAAASGISSTLLAGKVNNPLQAMQLVNQIRQQAQEGAFDFMAAQAGAIPEELPSLI
jgi:hypothetical protein